MQKFTKIEQPKPETTPETLYQSDYFKIIQKDGWQFDANPFDYVIAIVYLANHMELVFRLEKIPPFQHRHPDFDRFLTVISGTKDANEGFEDCLFREIFEETGIIIPKSYNEHKLLQSLFISKATSAKFHIYWVPITDNDYRIERAPGDGSKTEQQSTSFRIHINQLRTLKPLDMVTSLAIELAKNELGIK